MNFNTLLGKTKNLKALFLTVLIVGFTLSSCNNKSNKKDDDNSDNFDRAAMLTDVADLLIIPNFETLQTEVNDLKTAIETFNTTSNEANLIATREAWVDAAMAHQHCSAFGFGPGKLLLGPYASVLGVFPVNESAVEANIVDDSFDLPNSFSKDIRGFYAIEYLIYREGLSDADIVSSFDADRKAYLLLIVNELKSTFDNIVAEWNGSYRADFIASTGTSAGSSLSLYYNDFVKDYENLKNFKLELPAGLTAGFETPDPTLVEAYYSGISRDLIVEHFKSCTNIWSGTSKDGTNIQGFEEYLAVLVGGPELATQTNTTITQIEDLINALPAGKLSDNIADPAIETLRDKLQDNTANFKSSLSSILGISITYSSGDGD